jgi:hypothetical protein
MLGDFLPRAAAPIVHVAAVPAADGTGSVATPSASARKRISRPVSPPKGPQSVARSPG